MKKIIAFVLISIVLLSGAGLSSNISSGTYKKETSLCFSNLQIQEKETTLHLNLEGTNSIFIQKDYYIVPTHIETFTFPRCTKIKSITCTPEQIVEHKITKQIMISPEPVLPSQSFIKTADSKPIKTVNTWFEYTIGCGLTGKHREIILKIEVFPVQYYPEQNRITLAKNMDIEIQYEIDSEITSSSVEKYDLLILTPSDFTNEINSLVTHKNNRGLVTKQITLDEIYNSVYFPVTGRDNPEKIKYFIKNAIENWETRYVLLIGGAEKFPTRETHVYVNYNDGDAEVFVSDLYYADIYNQTGEFSSWDTNENDVFGEYDWGSSNEHDEVDIFPDVYIGRLACISSSEVESCVNKIITYETNEAYTSDWFTKIITIGGDTSPNDEEEILEGEYTNQAVIDIMDGFIPTKCWASEGTLGTRSFVNSALNDGAGFVDFAGHGNPSLWATHPFNNEDIWIPVGDYKNTNVISLINGDKLPIVITGACSVAKFNDKSDCFTWSFVQNPMGGGIASVGPAALSWGYDTSYVIEDLGGRMQLELFKAYKDKDAFTFGEMWANAISGYVHTRMDSGDYKTLEEWQPFGDPSLLIGEESLPPNTPDAPDGPSSGKTGTSYGYTASTTDPEGDTISYLFDWGDGTYSTWTDFKISGMNVSVDHTWESEGTYQIRARARDSHGTQSEWSEPLEISMPKEHRFDHVTEVFLKILERYAFFLAPYFQ